MSLDLEEHYDKIYRYCYFKVHNRELAEDITQETFLRYLEHYHSLTLVSALKYLYTIARHICIDEYRKPISSALDNQVQSAPTEDIWIEHLSCQAALSRLTPTEQELLLLRYVNEVPVAVIAELYNISRFATYRKLKAAINHFREALRKENLYE